MAGATAEESNDSSLGGETPMTAQTTDGEEAVGDALAALVDRIDDPVAALDYYQCNVLGYSIAEWADLRDVSDDTVSDHLETAKRQLAISYLREAREVLGRSPSRTEYDELNPPLSRGQIEDAFGSWNAAKEAAGLETYAKGAQAGEASGDGVHPDHRRVSAAECVEAVREAATRLGHVPERTEYETLDVSPSSATVRKRLSPNYRWPEVLATVDFSGTGIFDDTDTDTDTDIESECADAAATAEDDDSPAACAAAVREAAIQVGRVPTKEAYDATDVSPGSQIVRDRLAPNGRWAEVLARVDFETVADLMDSDRRQSM